MDKRFSYFKPRMYTRGWGCWFLLSRFRKKGLDDMRTTLWASTCWPSSQARVTSVKSLSSFSFPKAEQILSRKSFHCKNSFSSDLCIFTIFAPVWQVLVLVLLICCHHLIMLIHNTYLSKHFLIMGLFISQKKPLQYLPGPSGNEFWTMSNI